MKRRALEKDIQAVICDYLTFRRVFFYRQNNIPVNHNGEYRALPKHTPRGISDLVVVKDGVVYFLEVKRSGTCQTADQREFEASATAAGAVYRVVRSIEDVQVLGL